MTPRVVATLRLPMDTADLARVLAGLARSYPGAVLGDPEDHRLVPVVDPYITEEGQPIPEDQAA